MNIALVDDISRETGRMSGIINDYMSKRHLHADIKTFHSAEELLSGYRPLQYTLIFMDIFMDGMTGVDAARKIRETDNDTFIVFLTTSQGHAFDAFDVHAFQYILKSPDDEVLAASVTKVLDEIVALRSVNEDRIGFVIDGKEHSIPFPGIVYAQSQKNYVLINDDSGNGYRTRMTFSELCGALGRDNRFLQINRGIIINMDYITSFGKDSCELKGGISLPINVRDQKQLDLIRKNYVFSKLHGRQTLGGGKA